MNKKLIILFSCLAIVVILVISMSIAFTIMDVGVVTTSGLNLSDKEKSDIIYDSGIVKHSSIFGLDEDIAVSNVETLYPQLKVVSVERKFPNKVYLNIAKRVPIFSIATSDGKIALLDRELKVVDLVDDVVGNYITPIEGINIKSIQCGSYAQLDWLAQIVESAEGLSFVNERFSTFITNIQYENYEDGNNLMLLKTNTGVTFAIRTNDGVDAFNYFYTSYVGSQSEEKKSSGYFLVTTINDVQTIIWQNTLI